MHRGNKRKLFFVPSQTWTERRDWRALTDAWRRLFPFAERLDLRRPYTLVVASLVLPTVNDIAHIESNAYNGMGVIKVFFRVGTWADAGLAQVTAIAQTIVRAMPPGTMPPLIIRYSASTVPILQDSISSPKMSEQEIFHLSANQSRVGLATVRGAAMPWPYGGKTRIVSVDLDLTALKARNLAPIAVVNALNAQNLILPSGTAKIGGMEYEVRAGRSIWARA
jgi:multidrug efflux pump subunit AcrB